MIEETILSIINQTYENIEYLVIDGGSTDGTLEIIHRYEDQIDYFISEKDSGIYDAMNKGIRAASGDWINFMNAGDRFFSLDAVRAVFEDRSFDEEIGIIYGDTEMRHPEREPVIQQAFDLKFLDKKMIFCHQSSFTRSKIMKARLFDISFQLAADFNFFHRFQKSGGRFYYTPLTISSFDMSGISSEGRFLGEKEYLKARGFDPKKFFGIPYLIELTRIYLKIFLGRAIAGVLNKTLPPSLFLRVRNWKHNFFR